ncbi:MAG: EF-hand domain-containing protein [Polaromonas sp.]|nr:EF-hand domain-containing protein [Polaromonas sp.]
MTHSSSHPKNSSLTAARPVTTSRWLVLAGGLAVLTGMAFFITGQAHAQTPQVATPAPATTVAQAAPKYSAQDIEQAFSFIDGNKDGKLSRTEAAGFRGVARHFDEADLNKDSLLSREEFENALTSKNR